MIFPGRNYLILQELMKLKFQGMKMNESKESYKNHMDKRIREMYERTRKIKAEKIKEKMRKISETTKKKKK